LKFSDTTKRYRLRVLRTHIVCDYWTTGFELIRLCPLNVAVLHYRRASSNANGIELALYGGLFLTNFS